MDFARWGENVIIRKGAIVEVDRPVRKTRTQKPTSPQTNSYWLSKRLTKDITDNEITQLYYDDDGCLPIFIETGETVETVDTVTKGTETVETIESSDIEETVETIDTVPQETETVETIDTSAPTLETVETVETIDTVPQGTETVETIETSETMVPTTNKDFEDKNTSGD